MIEPLSQEYAGLQKRVDTLFADPHYTRECDESEFYLSIVEQLANHGLLQFLAPEPSARTLCFLRYAIAHKSALADLLFAMQGLGSYPIALAGSEAQKKRYVQSAASGKLIAAFAMTEPDAGSDAASMKLQAKRKGNGYILSGTKTLISNAGLADFYTVFARTSDSGRPISAFVVEAETAGLSVMDQRMVSTHPIGQVEFNDCFVEENQMLGVEGDGLKIAYSTLDVFRPSVAAAAIGMAQRAFEEAIGYARSRKQFGKALAEFQSIQFKIAEMAQMLRASKLLIWDAATRKDEGAERITFESAIAKSFATEAAQKIIDESLQIHGGAGLIKGHITERLYRDIRALRIYEGTTEILKSVIAQHILK